MRAIFGLVSLVVVLAVVGVIAKKQLTATRSAVPALAVPSMEGAPTLKTNPDATVKVQSQQIQQQYKQALESAMQQPRSMPEDSEKPKN